MYLVDRIIERCENSSRDWREGATGGRTLRITQEDYDACGKEELIEEVQRLERAGLVTVKKWVVPDSDVELVAYQVEHLPDFYRLADSESGEEYWPKQAKVNYYIRMIDQELSEGFQKEWIENYLEKLKLPPRGSSPKPRHESRKEETRSSRCHVGNSDSFCLWYFMWSAKIRDKVQ